MRRNFILILLLLLSLISCNVSVDKLKTEEDLIEELKYSTYESYYDWKLIDQGMINVKKHIKVKFTIDSIVMIMALDKDNTEIINEIHLKPGYNNIIAENSSS